MNVIDRQIWHGKFASIDWEVPQITVKSDQLARPGYSSTLGNEFADHESVLLAKVSLLANMIRASKACIAYTGAGISTSAGISDYASVPVFQSSMHSNSPMVAQPTFSHQVLVQMYLSNYLKRWIQQNHDGLPQKAGLPQHAINEIHGSLYDPSNPVVPMTGSIRSDLFEDIIEWSEKTDLVLALGTSLSGMNADRIVTIVGSKMSCNDWKQGTLHGVVIVSKQQTQYDHLASLRIFCDLDIFSRLLDIELALNTPLNPSPLTIPSHIRLHSPNDIISNDLSQSSIIINTEVASESNLFLLPYDSTTGLLLPSHSFHSSHNPLPYTVFDLFEGARVRITGGPFQGDEGEVICRGRGGHWRIRFYHSIGRQKQFKAPMERVLGVWWIIAAAEGRIPCFPVVNVVPIDPT